MHPRIERGFRILLGRLLASGGRGEVEAEVERLLAHARAEAREQGVPLARALARTWAGARAGAAAARHGVDPARGPAAPARGPSAPVRDASASEVLERRIVADASLAVVWVPSALGMDEQLAMVKAELGLALRTPRCMACGGKLVPREKEAVRERIAAALHAACASRPGGSQ